MSPDRTIIIWEETECNRISPVVHVYYNGIRIQCQYFKALKFNVRKYKILQ